MQAGPTKLKISNPKSKLRIQVLSFQNVPKIFVGDSHQQIYRFRGAVDAMKQVDAGVALRLSQTFRFGTRLMVVVMIMVVVLMIIVLIIMINMIIMIIMIVIMFGNGGVNCAVITLMMPPL